MDITVWITFVLTSLVVVIIPGPTILLVVGRAMSGTKKEAAALCSGVALGDFVAMSLSLLGVGTLIATSAMAYQTLKYAGAIYLIYMGVQMLRAGSGVNFSSAPPSSKANMRDAFIVTALNPKSITFFVAFVPQFISLDRPYWFQALLLLATYVFIGAVNAFMYAFAVNQMRNFFQNTSTQIWFSRLGGTLLISAAVWVLAKSRTA